MSDLEIPNPIRDAIDAYHESLPNEPRPHLGCSLVGHHCERWIWYSFRWAVLEKFPGRILRLFRRGQMEEETIAKDLRAIGCDLQTVDENGEQLRVDLGSHLSGSMDGIIHSGLPGAPKSKHVLEAKTHGSKSYKSLTKDGLKTSKWQHYVQMQLYMLGTGIKRALYYPVSKDDDDIAPERVKFDREVAEKYRDKGHRIALSDRAPMRVSERADWYQCKMCAAHPICHEKKTTMEINCRTCAHSTPKPDSTWYCERWGVPIPEDGQRLGCDSHVIHPDLTGAKWESIGEPFAVAFDGHINGDPNEHPGAIKSKDLVQILNKKGKK